MLEDLKGDQEIDGKWGGESSFKCESALDSSGNPAAWTLKSLADDVEESGETAVFLDTAQRKALIAAAAAAAKSEPAESLNQPLPREARCRTRHSANVP